MLEDGTVYHPAFDDGFVDGGELPVTNDAMRFLQLSGSQVQPSGEALIADIAHKVAPFTMVSATGLRFTIMQAIRVVAERIPGVLVECGVWRGGCSIAMLLVQRELLGRVEHPVYLFDSFEGLPTAAQADGPLATEWQQATDSPQFFDNCRASVEEVQEALASFGFRDGDYHLIKGWFDQTLPQARSSFSAPNIALLRLDADWYESTRTCLDQLAPAVSEGGVVIIDDYYAWDGCARAVHEYLAKHNLPYRIRSLPQFLGAYLVKKAHRDQSGALDDGVQFENTFIGPSTDGSNYRELELAKSWLEDQRARWEDTATRLERVTSEQRAWIIELEASKAWLAEQSEAWQRAFHASEAMRAAATDDADESSGAHE